VDCHGQQRTNDTHVSRTDPEAQLARKGKGQETRLCYAGHVLMEDRHGLILDVDVSHATGCDARPDGQVGDGRRWEPTRGTTRGPSCGRCAHGASHRLSPRTPAGGGVRSMGGPRGTRATP